MKLFDVAKRYAARVPAKAAVPALLGFSGVAAAQTTGGGGGGISSVASAVDWASVITGVVGIGVATIGVIIVVKGIMWFFSMTKRG